MWFHIVANMYAEDSLNDSNMQVALLAMLLSIQIQEVCTTMYNSHLHLEH